MVLTYFSEDFDKMSLSEIFKLMVKQFITEPIVLHTMEISLEELHLTFTRASLGKQHCVIWSMLLILFHVTAEDNMTCKLWI